MSIDFYLWAGRNGVDYQKNSTYSGSNNFTFNFSYSTDIFKNKKLPGHWRGIFKYFYDTDRPHTHPWEMLGLSEKPSWWETKYGVAPYSAGNDVLWDDLRRGYNVNNGTTDKRYVRTNLTSYIPVDVNGNIKDPIAIGLVKNYDHTGINKPWSFGDQGPAETAWRRSTAYSYSIIKLLALMKPAKFFSLYIDNSNLKTNVSNNIVDKDTEIRQVLSTVKYFAETSINAISGVVTRYTTAGYQPLVVNYLTSRNLSSATFFYNRLKKLNVQLAYKLGGFTDKENLKILTDSVSPGSTAGSQFLPNENYKILFRTSNPVKTYAYSGVLIELNADVSVDGSTLAGGYKVIGYNTIRPYFKIYKPLKNTSSTRIKIGSADAVVYKDWRQVAETIPYGRVFSDKQEVVNFLIGYGKYLEANGFNFDKFSRELKEPSNFLTATKEFLYWTTQGWSVGSAITVSPGANGFSLDTTNSVVGRLRNVAGDYTVLDASGRTIERQKISTKRIGTTFDISIKDDNIGLFNISMNAVQKEHMLLFDNKTVFSDILLDLATGFRQERLKIVGWKTGSWNGDYYAPGFIFDSAQVNLWVANVDYEIGDTVEYQASFYVAKVNHNASSKFASENWQKKDSKPSPQLIPNFDYKITQFKDFYNLETNNFDEAQQSLAQHLVGYQSRDYLENLFVNDITQYKFYQGYIREKGSKNAIDKLLKAKFSDENINLNLYPEWMIRAGDFGNVDGKQSIQITMDDTKFNNNLESIELFDTETYTKNYARSVPVVKTNLYSKPLEYTASSTFGLYDYTAEGYDRDVVRKLPIAGYPRVEDVQHTAFNVKDIENLDITKVKQNELIWIANKTNLDWDVFRVTPAKTSVWPYVTLKIVSMQSINSATQLTVTFNNVHTFIVGDFIGISQSQHSTVNGVYEIKTISSSKSVIFDFSDTLNAVPVLQDLSTVSTYGNIYKFVSVRLATMDNVNDLIAYSEYKDKNVTYNKPGDKVFVDNATSKWKVYEKIDPYTTATVKSPDITSDQDFGWQVVARNDGRTLVTSAPNQGQGVLHFMFRRTTSTPFAVEKSVTMTENNNTTSKLGYSLSMSTDENFVIAGAPYTNTIGTDGSTRFVNAGLLKIFQFNSTSLTYSELPNGTLTPPTDAQFQNFGWSHALSETGTTVSTQTANVKFLFVSAPGYQFSQGIVYLYKWTVGIDGSTYDTWTQTTSIRSNPVHGGDRFGHQVVANDNGDIVAISSKTPSRAGRVQIFIRSSDTSDDGSTQDTFVQTQTLAGTASDGSTLNTEFGDSLAMSKDGKTLIIGAPGVDDGQQADAGAVYYYKFGADGSTNTFVLQQTLTGPESQTNLRFGSRVSLNEAGNRLVIGASKLNDSREIKFDGGSTTFDLQDTAIVDMNIGSGGAFTATMYNSKFVVDDKLVTTSVSANDDFGRDVAVTDQAVFVGAPDDDVHTNKAIPDGSTIVENDGSVTVFDLTTADDYAWKELHTETDLVDNRKIVSAFTFNRATSKVLDYLDYYDPIKGRIFGIADKEINYKTIHDPATYNTGTTVQDVNEGTAWGEEHLGEVWWDLSTVKWTWYEQGTQEFKSQHWGELFPGSSVDIYEWTRSTLLPSEWISRADNQQGLAEGISGQPLVADDTVLTVKQKYNSALDTFVNYYYYWVKKFHLYK